MQQYLQRFSDPLHALLRIVAGFLFACHGADKLFGVFGRTPPDSAVMWAAGVIELVGGGLICAGLLTSWAAFICSGEMAVAYFMAHQPRALFPIQNRGELALLYAYIFLYLAAKGSGPWGLGAVIGSSRNR